MPFYEYQCQACGAHAEVLQKITDAPLKKCPDCGKSRLVKLVSAPVFRLKGGGWYETDFKGDKDVKRNLVDTDKGDAKADAPAEEKSAGKSEESGGPAAAAATPAATEPKPKAKAGAVSSKPATRATAARRPAAAGKPARARSKGAKAKR